MARLITDTTSTLSPETAARYGIPVIPQVIIFGQDSYLEGIEIDNATFMRRLVSTREPPKTAAPPPELFVEQFRRLAPLGEPILCLHPSAQISGTVNSATVAAREFPGCDIRVIDTGIVGSPLGELAILAAQWAAAGEPADAIEQRIRDLAGRCHIYFVVATLDYLARGGRIGGASAILGSLLQIKPILTLRDGRVELLERQRTHGRALKRMIELVHENLPDAAEAHVTLMHGGVSEQAHALADELARDLGLAQVPIADMPPAIVTHGGPGVLGIGFFAPAPLAIDAASTAHPSEHNHADSRS